MTGHLRHAVVVLAVILAGCSVSSKSDDPVAQSKGAELVAAVQRAGLAENLTVDVAASLYGTDASNVCEVFADGLTSGEYLLLLGNPSNRRRKTITADSVEYARLVVATYCPDLRADFDEAVADINPFEVTR